MISDSRLLTIPEAADLLAVSPARAYELARLGDLPCVRIGRQVRIDPVRLRAWILRGGVGLKALDQGSESGP